MTVQCNLFLFLVVSAGAISCHRGREPSQGSGLGTSRTEDGTGSSGTVDTTGNTGSSGRDTTTDREGSTPGGTMLDSGTAPDSYETTTDAGSGGWDAGTSDAGRAGGLGTGSAPTHRRS